MKKFFLTLFLFAAFSVNAFAVNNNRIPLTPTITPLRIFFAVLAVIGFVVAEYYFNKIREERVDNFIEFIESLEKENGKN